MMRRSPFDKKVLAELIIKHFHFLEELSTNFKGIQLRGKIDSGILFTLSEANNKELITTLKKKDLMICVNGLFLI